MRIITVEEHFHHPEVMARVQELSGQWPPPPVVADDGFSRFFEGFMPDKDSAEQLGGTIGAHGSGRNRHPGGFTWRKQSQQAGPP